MPPLEPTTTVRYGAHGAVKERVVPRCQSLLAGDRQCGNAIARWQPGPHCHWHRATPDDDGDAMPETLRLVLTQLTTNRHDLASEHEALYVTMTGRLVGPVEGILPLIREQWARRPTLEISVALVSEEE